MTTDIDTTFEPKSPERVAKTPLNHLKQSFSDFFGHWHHEEKNDVLGPIEMDNRVELDYGHIVWKSKKTGWLGKLHKLLKRFTQKCRLPGENSTSPSGITIFRDPHFREDDMRKHKIGSKLLQTAPSPQNSLTTIPETFDPWSVEEVTLMPDAFVASEISDGNIVYHIYFSKSVPPERPETSKALLSVGDFPSCSSHMSPSPVPKLQRPTTLDLSKDGHRTKTRPSDLDLSGLSNEPTSLHFWQ